MDLSPAPLAHLFSSGSVLLVVRGVGDGLPFLDVSGSSRATLGREPRDLIATPFSDLVHPDDRAAFEHGFREALAEGRDQFVLPDYRIRHADGSWVWVQDSVHVEPAGGDANGAPATTTACLVDVTERREARDQLDQQRRRLELVVEGTRLGMWDWNPRTGDVVFNAMWAEMLGYEHGEISNRLEEWENRVHPEDLASCYADIQAHMEGKVGFYENIHRMRHKDGSWVHILDRGKIVERDADGQPVRFTGTHTDITPQKNAAERLQRILDTATDAYFAIDESGKIQQWNVAAYLLFGRPRGRAIGVHVSSLFVEAPERAAALAVILDAARKRERRELQALDPEGRPFPLELSVSEVSSGGELCFHVFGRDQTQRRQLEARVAMAEKLESIGQLAAGIAHEINTPTQYVGHNTLFLQESFEELAPLLGMASELAGSILREGDAVERAEELERALEAADVEELGEEIPKAIRQSLEGIGHVGRIVQAMKEFSHPGGEEKTWVDLNHAVESTATVATNEWKYRADLELDLDPGLPEVCCRAGEVNQVLLNLIVNAAHAIGDGQVEGEGQRGLIRVVTLRVGEHVEVRISDTGPGIPEDIRARIFDPFFTTKEVGRGTGQGLSIAHDVVVNNHGGSIDFETARGKGTTFLIRLPIGEEAEVEDD